MPPKKGGRKPSAAAGKGAGGGRRKADAGLPSELEEDVDRYLDGRSKLMMGAEEESEEEEERELVMGVGGDDDDDDDDEDGDDSEEDGVKSGKNLEGIMSDDEEEQERGEQGWGKDKSDYYDRDEMSDTDDEEEEEKEAKRIRAKQSDALKSADFGEDDIADSEEEDDDTFEAATSGKKKVTKKVISLKKGKRKEAPVSLDNDDAEEESVERDLTGLSAAERMDILANSAPELKSLVADMKIYLAEIRTRLVPLKERANLGQIASDSGEAYVDCKLRLLTSYCTNVAFYLLLKSQGKAVRNHPVIDQLVELRSNIERMAPLDEKLENEVDYVLSAPLGAVRRGAAEEDKESMDSDEADFDKMDFDALAAELGGLVPTAGGSGKKKAKSKSKVAKPQREMREEFMDDEDEEDEEDEEHEQRKRKRKMGANMETTDDYGDRDELVDKDEDSSAIKFARKRTLRQFVASQDQAAKARAQNRIEHSGEVDVPIRDRRAEIEKVADRKQRIMAKMVAAEHRAEAENEARQMVGADVGEDDYYMAVKAAQVAKKGKKADAKKPKLMEYLPEQTVAEGEKRGAGNFIVKNRGLVPHRSKEKKNPRVKHRKKFEKAKIKERTSFYGKQTRDDRGAYGGETTGIKAHISRSRKF